MKEWLKVPKKERKQEEIKKYEKEEFKVTEKRIESVKKRETKKTEPSTGTSRIEQMAMKFGETSKSRKENIEKEEKLRMERKKRETKVRERVAQIERAAGPDRKAQRSSRDGAHGQVQRGLRGGGGEPQGVIGRVTERSGALVKGLGLEKRVQEKRVIAHGQVQGVLGD